MGVFDVKRGNTEWDDEADGDILACTRGGVNSASERFIEINRKKNI